MLPHQCSNGKSTVKRVSYCHTLHQKLAPKVLKPFCSPVKGLFTLMQRSLTLPCSQNKGDHINSINI